VTTNRFAAGLCPDIGGEVKLDISDWGAGQHLVWLGAEDYRSLALDYGEAKLVLTPAEARELAEDLIMAAEKAEAADRGQKR